MADPAQPPINTVSIGKSDLPASTSRPLLITAEQAAIEARLIHELAESRASLFREIEKQPSAIQAAAQYFMQRFTEAGFHDGSPEQRHEFANFIPRIAEDGKKLARTSSSRTGVDILMKTRSIAERELARHASDPWKAKLDRLMIESYDRAITLYCEEQHIMRPTTEQSR
jgi:hypothetical protein